jgi:hypothetical protein
MMARGNRSKITILECTTSISTPSVLTEWMTLFVGFGTSDTLRLPIFTFERRVVQKSYTILSLLTSCVVTLKRSSTAINDSLKNEKPLVKSFP